MNRIDLANWIQTLRPYQVRANTIGLEVERGSRSLLASPTGTGKGTMQLGLLRALLERGDDAWIVTPSLEVMRGYLERCGATPDDLRASNARLAKMGAQIRVTTPVRLRNRLRKNKQTPPTTIIVDEAHHATDQTVAGGGLETLCPNTAWIGFTATAFRGTPEETKALRDTWGEPTTILTLPGAVENGSWALPTWRVEPLIDGVNLLEERGDLDSDEATMDAIDPLARLIASLDLTTPTAVTLNSVAAAEALTDALGKLAVTAYTVVGTTPADQRADAYTAVKQARTTRALLVSVKVLGEGVDFPWLRRWVDASPTLSPVAFLQKLGRITRPGDQAPEYLGTNRNLERHGYLLQGALPRDEIRKAQEAFGGPSVRGARAGLLKAVARLKPIALPLAGGVKGTMWAIWTPAQQGGSGAERCILVDPTSDRVICAERELRQGRGRERYGPWAKIPTPEKIQGFRASRLHGPVSPARLAWWKNDATSLGLDVEVTPTTAQFWAVPVLKEIGEDLLPAQERSQAGPKTAPRKPREAHTGETTACWAKLPGGAWGARVEPAEAAQVGATVMVKRRSGEGQAMVISEVIERYDDAALVAVRKAEKPTEPAAGETATIRDGYYTIVDPDGGKHRTYRVRTQPADAKFAPGRQVFALLTGPQNTADYQGLGFVAGNTVRIWRSREAHEEKATIAFAAITGDAGKAGKLYALESGRCYVCARPLTTPGSIEAGIGPKCASRGL